MKNRKILGMICLGLLAFSCSDTDDGSAVNGITIYEKIQGHWDATSVKMVDEVAKATGAPVFEQNLTNEFNYSQLSVAFNVDDNMNPTTYEVLGNVPPLFEPQGYYELSSPFQPASAGTPVKIYLYSDQAKTNKTGELRITSVPGSNGQMELTLLRTSGNIAFVSYVFKFTAQ